MHKANALLPAANSLPLEPHLNKDAVGMQPTFHYAETLQVSAALQSFFLARDLNERVTLIILLLPPPSQSAALCAAFGRARN